MINSKNSLRIYLKADMIANRGKEKYSVTELIYHLFFPDYIMNYLKCLRKEEYYINCKKSTSLLRIINKIRFQRLSVKLGFSISANVFDYGLIIPHYGTIVVGSGNHIGKYAVLHTSTCITAGSKRIGDGLYLSTGAKIINDISLGNNISVSANSLVNKNITGDNLLIAGIPAKIIKDSEAWYIRDGIDYMNKINSIKNIKYQ